MPQEWIAVKHKDTGAVTSVTRLQLEEVYAEKGWSEVSSTDSEEDLRAAASALGREVPSSPAEGPNETPGGDA